jgi:anti-anti-sigma factor
MKRHLTASAVEVGAREGDAAGDGASRSERVMRTPFSSTTSVGSATSEREVTLSSVTTRMHTIVPTGELTQRSAYVLEVEIERVCAEGVTAITLDLTELAYIDPIGVAVIAFRSGLCRRRGFEFAVIPGSPLMRRAFEQAGVESVLARSEDAAPTLRSARC